MSKEVLFTRPELYTPRKNFIDCTEYLVCSCIKSKGLPFHWLFSDSWGFSYRTLTDIGAFPDELPSPFWCNLEKLYQVRPVKHLGRDLKELVHDVIFKQHSAIVITGDIWHIPYHIVCYKKDHFTHDLLITDYNPRTDELFIVDFVPEFTGWMPFSIINDFYVAGGHLNDAAFGFELSQPSLDNTDELLPKQLSSLCSKMSGTEEQHISTGLHGLEQFKNDLFAEIDFTELIDHWWDPLKQIVYVRESFLEFLHFIHKESLLPHQVTLLPEFIDTVDRITNKWFSIRNTWKKLQMRGGVSAEQVIMRLETVIELEKQCLAYAGELLAVSHRKG